MNTMAPQEKNLAAALARLLWYCNGKLGKNPYTVEEFSRGLEALSKATGVPMADLTQEKCKELAASLSGVPDIEPFDLARAKNELVMCIPNRRIFRYSHQAEGADSHVFYEENGDGAEWFFTSKGMLVGDLPEEFGRLYCINPATILSPLAQSLKAISDLHKLQVEAGKDGLSSLRWLVSRLRLHPDTDQALRLRSLLYSLFNGRGTNLNDLQTLDFDNRREFCAVALGVGCPDFPYHAIREEFTKVGLRDWFLAASDR